MPGPDRYETLARWYDMTAARALRSAYARIARLCAERRRTSILDIGCGTGRLASDLAALGMRVTGIDTSPAMLALAAGGGKEPGTPAFVLSGAPFPFAPGSFDAAVASMVLHESDEEPETLLAEALRVAPVCIVLEWRMPERNLDYCTQPLVHAVERLAGKKHYARFRNFARKGYLHGAAGRAGATVVSEEILAGGSMVLAETIFPG